MNTLTTNVIPSAAIAQLEVQQTAEKNRADVDMALLDGIDKMIAASEGYDADKRDFKETANLQQFRADTGLIHLIQTEQTPFGLSPVSEMDAGFTDHAFGQFLNSVSPSYFKGSGKTMRRDDWAKMQSDFPQHFAPIMNELLDRYSDRKLQRQFRNRDAGALLFRTYKSNVRAVASSGYAALNNTELLKMVVDILKPELAAMPDIRRVRSHVSPDDMTLQIGFRSITKQEAGMESEDKAPYRTGFVLTNDEVGRGSMRLASAIWRGPCTNSIVIDNAGAINLKHFGSVPAMMTMIKSHMIQMLKLSGQHIEALFQAEYDKLPDMASVLAGMAKEYKWSQSFRDAVNVGTEGQHNRAGVINGISYAAHAATESNEDYLKAASLAGAILVSPDSIFAKARKLVSA